MFCCTLQNSFLRSTPLLTKTQVRRSPMARSTRTAATDESTPPESAQMAWPSPTCSRMAATVDWMKCAGVQFGLAWQMLNRKLRSRFAALGRVVHLGMELHCPDVARSGSAMPATAFGGSRGQVEAGRQIQRFIAVRHPDVERSAGRPAKSGVVGLPGTTETSAWPYSRLSAERTFPPR